MGVSGKSGTVARLSLLFGLVVWSILACQAEEGIAISPARSLQRLSVEVVAEYPHDPRAFTQGLLWHGGKLYESTGNYGRSSLREVRFETGDVVRQVNLSSELFAEGLAKVGRELVQLTWRKGVALVYEFPSFRESRRMNYAGEGWGLSYDGTWLVMSDGSHILTYRDPKSMAVWKKLPVTLRGKPVRFLNELECAQGAIFANIWQQTYIIRIDPRTGKVDAVVDASSLLTVARRPPGGVLNGIAFAPERGTFFVTGKNWSSLFEVTFE
jgi:glutaminyl-peptide cyclotransferase